MLWSDKATAAVIAAACAVSIILGFLFAYGLGRLHVQNQAVLYGHGEWVQTSARYKDFKWKEAN